MSYEFIFCTGAPGSKWSAVSATFRANFSEIDASDLNNSDFVHYMKNDYMRETHHGAYFGPGNKFGENFHDIQNNYTVESFIEECLKPFNDSTKPVKLIRSHWFAYNLPWLHENFKGHKMLLVSQNPRKSKEWWDFVGGWDIKHPNYDWYENDERMIKQIIEEENNITNYVNAHNMKWTDANWIKRRVMADTIQFDYNLNCFSNDITNRLIDPNSYWRFSFSTIK